MSELASDDFFDHLDQDLGWRKKELSRLKLGIEQGAHTGKKDIFWVRMSLVFLYSHWEGYIKSCSQAYLVFLNSLYLKNSEVAMNLRALFIQEKYREVRQSKKLRFEMDRISDVLYGDSEVFCIDPAYAIKAKSNLKFEVFEEIAVRVGVDVSLFALKEKLIDKRLLKYRNKISHGEVTENFMELKTAYNELRVDVVELLEEFKLQLILIVETERYRV